jgi:GNAT superfamily N-acetyltransferase
MGRLLPGTTVRVRRGRRGDLAQVQALLGADAGARLERVFRRILADLGSDVYVAEDGGGEIVGLVSVVYARSLVRGGLAAMLDGARTRGTPAPSTLLEGLVAFAEERARKRGCRRLTVCLEPEEAGLRATLVARGYRAGEFLVTDLAGRA